MSPWHARSFRALGSDCRIVAPDAQLADVGVGLVADLERRWSRFVDDSEVSRVNAHAGDVCVVSPSTFELFRRAEAARSATGGRFNPLLLDHLVAIGYDRTWASVSADGPAVAGTAIPVSDEPIDCFDDVCAVRIPAGTRFDPGGIGKGLAADLVTDALRDRGAERLQIELGGDVRVIGDHWEGGRWAIHVDDCGEGSSAAVLTLAEGGAATSSRRRRRWTRGGVDYHHLIDPRTGTSADTDLDTVTVIAAELWWAEVVAKVALIDGSARARDRFAQHGVRGIIVHTDDDGILPARHEIVDGIAA